MRAGPAGRFAAADYIDYSAVEPGGSERSGAAHSALEIHPSSMNKASAARRDHRD